MHCAKFLLTRTSDWLIGVSAGLCTLKQLSGPSYVTCVAFWVEPCKKLPLMSESTTAFATAGLIKDIAYCPKDDLCEVQDAHGICLLLQAAWTITMATTQPCVLCTLKHYLCCHVRIVVQLCTTIIAHTVAVTVTITCWS